MALYTPEQFALNNEATIRHLISAYPFALLVSVADDVPVMTHVPLVLDAAGRLLGHVAQANPHAGLLSDGASATAVFSGPHGYISPTSYSKPGVPTWNYATVHVAARVQVLSRDEEKLAVMDSLIRTFDDPARLAISRHMRVDEQRPLLGGIHVFVLHIESMQAKFKLSQNKSLQERRNIIAALRANDRYEDTALAELMESALQATLNSTHEDRT